MGSDSRKHNKDYFTIAGRTPGPAGPLKHFKDQLSQGRAVLRRDEERKLPHERPLAGTPRHEEEEQEQARHAMHHSVLDRLPKPVGAAGVPGSMKAIPTEQPEATHEPDTQPARRDEREQQRPKKSAHEPRAESPAYGYGIPASEDTALGHDREPFAREASALRDEHRLGPVAQRVVRTFPWAFGVIGDAARVIDRPIKRTLHKLQWLGREARRA